MNLALIKKRDQLIKNKKLSKAYGKMNNLIEALNHKEIPADVMSVIQNDIDKVQVYNEMEKELVTEKELAKEINKTYCKILKFLQKNMKLVPKNYYRNLWMSLGMASFGMPFGIGISTALDNYGFLGIGVGIGMVIGMALGSILDQRAEKKGEQLELEASEY